ncbi:hypothetical protein [Micromonospora sp. NBC_01796]|uniref:hypothetical protein n=1 Tax=Micromonospora sp. NBC_01796 TaxID=2975987 RepID=UPI002DD9D194|nr:hypothetical protein [Micromonospora sp. NBC_01796]WSA84123.1 hypothetical protein OIE47_27710 [Micromonospora sp. NBC_01796]
MRARVLAAFAAAVLVTAVPAPAAAHPFGDPQTVAITLDEHRPEVVHVRWRVGGPDDLTLLGVSLGLLPSDRVLLDDAVDYRSTDPALIGSSTQLGAYLLKQITVADGGRQCVGAVEPPMALARTGATVDYTCPEPVGTVTVAVRMLTDLSPAYRTLATGPGGQRALYDSSTDSHDWVLAGAVPRRDTSPGRTAALRPAAVAGGTLVAVLAALLVWRRLRRPRAVVGP